MPPQGTDLVLPTNVPDVEFDLPKCDGLDVEADGGDGCYFLVEFEFVEDGLDGQSVSDQMEFGARKRCPTRLSSCIKTEHKKAHFFCSEDLPHHFGELAAHGCRLATRVGDRTSSPKD